MNNRNGPFIAMSIINTLVWAAFIDPLDYLYSVLSTLHPAATILLLSQILLPLCSNPSKDPLLCCPQASLCFLEPWAGSCLGFFALASPSASVALLPAVCLANCLTSKSLLRSFLSWRLVLIACFLWWPHLLLDPRHYIPSLLHFLLLYIALTTFRASLVAQTVKNLPAMQETQVRSLGWEEPLEKGMATHSSILA